MKRMGAIEVRMVFQADGDEEPLFRYLEKIDARSRSAAGKVLFIELFRTRDSRIERVVEH